MFTVHTSENGEFKFNNLPLNFEYQLRIHGEQDFICANLKMKRKKYLIFKILGMDLKMLILRHQEWQRVLGARYLYRWNAEQLHDV